MLGGEFLVAVFLVAVITAIGVWLLTLDELIAGLAGVLTVAILWLMISFRIGKRKQIFIAQLGDALTTISNALRTGYSFQQSMDAVTKEMEQPSRNGKAAQKFCGYVFVQKNFSPAYNFLLRRTGLGQKNYFRRRQA